MKTAFPILTLFASLIAFAPATAQQIARCDTDTRADMIAEPWEENTGTFGFVGAVRVALLDKVRPGNARYQIMILTPPRNEYRQRYCFTLSHTAEQGFAKADYSQLESEYDQSVGMLFRMPVEILDEGQKTPKRLVFAVNEATASIQAVLQDPSTRYEGDQYDEAIANQSKTDDPEDPSTADPDALAQ